MPPPDPEEDAPEWPLVNLETGELHSCETVDPCFEGTFFDELSCDCYFSKQPCEKSCELGEMFDPRDQCKCISQEDYKGLYPSWATPAQITLAWEKGLKTMGAGYVKGEDHLPERPEEEDEDAEADEEDEELTDQEKLDRLRNKQEKETELYESIKKAIDAGKDLFGISTDSAMTVSSFAALATIALLN